MNIEELKTVIAQEIDWCKKNHGFRSRDFEDGFVAGLQQTIFFLDMYELCECGHEKHLHTTFDILGSCTVDVLSENPCTCTKFRPTKRVPDAGDSAASQELSPQSGESTPEVEPAATQRR